MLAPTSSGPPISLVKAGSGRAYYIGLRAARTSDGLVAVDVRDAGAGIKAEDRQAVFEPFWTTRREGLGLGPPT